jgi:hypothetical protein
MKRPKRVHLGKLVTPAEDDELWSRSQCHWLYINDAFELESWSVDEIDGVVYTWCCDD